MEGWRIVGLYLYTDTERAVFDPMNSFDDIDFKVYIGGPPKNTSWEFWFDTLYATFTYSVDGDYLLTLSGVEFLIFDGRFFT